MEYIRDEVKQLQNWDAIPWHLDECSSPKWHLIDWPSYSPPHHAIFTANNILSSVHELRTKIIIIIIIMLSTYRRTGTMSIPTTLTQYLMPLRHHECLPKFSTSSVFGSTAQIAID